MAPSPFSVKDPPSDSACTPPRIIRIPANPIKQPASLRMVILSSRNMMIARRIAKKLPDALMIVPRTPEILASAIKKKKYCPIVCITARIRIFPTDPACGRRKVRAIAEPKRITIPPAIIKRAPASVIREAVSAASMRNNSYATLMTGAALPQRKQQKKAVTNNTGNQSHRILFFRDEPFIFIIRPPA